MISIEDFDKVEMRAGTVIDVKNNKKSRKRMITVQFTDIG